MPLHAQILCIGGNGLVALLMGLATLMTMQEGNTGLTVFMLLLTVSAGYSTWVLLKFRRYLSAEETLQREVQIERLREELDALKANNVDEPPPPEARH